MSKFEEPVVITCALTGVLATREQCPHIPYTPKEIAQDAKRAYDAGATVVHIHAREDDGAPSWRLEVFQEIATETRALCPIILNFSTGTMDDDTSMQEAIIREVKPEIAALNMGTMNYAKFSKSRKDFVFDMIFPNPFSKIKTLLACMNESGVKPELECFDSGHTNSIWPLYEMELLKKPTQFSFVMNVLGGIPPSLEAIQLQRNQLPDGATWEVIGIGRPQWRLLAASLVLGGNIRVGLEDNFYLPSGTMAEGNGPLVEQAVRLTESVGRRVANIDEARAHLSLG